MNLFGFLGGSKSYLGVDIGTTSIKIVELQGGKHNPRLANYALLENFGHFERSNNVIQANALKISEDETVALLSILLKQTRFSSKSVVASIPSFASFISMIEMPQMGEDEIVKAMGFQIKQSIPLPLSDIAVDWIRVGEREDENGFVKQQILIVAIPNETIARYQAIFKRVGLSLRALEVETLSYARAVVGADQTPTLVMDIGARSTNITFVDQGFVKHNTQIDYAGDTLTQAVSKGLGISGRRAEELKKQRGIMGGPGEYELSTLEIPFVDVMISEMQKVAARLEQEVGAKAQRVLLIGGGANLLGIEHYTEQQMGLPTVLGNGFLYVDALPEVSVVLKELQTRFATAIGLGMKNFVK